MKFRNRIMPAALLAAFILSSLPGSSAFAEEITEASEKTAESSVTESENLSEVTEEQESSEEIPDEEKQPEEIPQEESPQEEQGGAEGFVVRLYTQVLGRGADGAGLRNWTELLSTHRYTAADTACGFVFSDEYKSRKTTDEEFITMLYSVMMNRDPDSSGMKNWLSALEKGVSRRYILRSFVGSDEFSDICKKYDVERGSVSLKENRDKNIGVTDFVQRMYNGFLGRKSDENGLNNWTGQLLEGRKTACDVIDGFVQSKEFLGKNVSDEDYTDMLYSVILGRSADSAGKAGWVKKLKNGYTREFVLKGFTGSGEFSKMCADCSVTRGSTKIKGWQKDAGGMTWYSDEGVRAADKILNIDDHTYYFDRNGYLGNGWYSLNGSRRYVGYGYLLPANGTDWGKAFSEGKIKYPESYDNEMKIPDIYQFNYKTPVCWMWGVPKTVSSSGCGAASSSMVIEYLTGRKDLDPQTLFTWAYNNGQYAGYGLAEYTLTNFMKLAGLKGTWIKADSGKSKESEYSRIKTELTAALKAGKPVIPLMLEGYFTTDGHYIVITGVTDDGYFYVNDPNNSSRGVFVYQPEEVIKQAKCFMICEK